MKWKQGYAYNQHLYKETVDPFSWASCGYFLLISLWACAAGWGGIVMVGSTIQGCINLYWMTELEGRTGKHCPDQEPNIFPSGPTSLLLVTRVLSYPSLRSERFVGEDPGDKVESDNRHFMVWPLWFWIFLTERKRVCGSICRVSCALFQRGHTHFSDSSTWHIRLSYGTFFLIWSYDKVGY